MLTPDEMVYIQDYIGSHIDHCRYGSEDADRCFSEMMHELRNGPWTFSGEGEDPDLVTFVRDVVDRYLWRGNDSPDTPIITRSMNLLTYLKSSYATPLSRHALTVNEIRAIRGLLPYTKAPGDAAGTEEEIRRQTRRPQHFGKPSRIDPDPMTTPEPGPRQAMLREAVRYIYDLAKAEDLVFPLTRADRESVIRRTTKLLMKRYQNQDYKETEYLVTQALDEVESRRNMTERQPLTGALNTPPSFDREKPFAGFAEGGPLRVDVHLPPHAGVEARRETGHGFQFDNWAVVTDYYDIVDTFSNYTSALEAAKKLREYGVDAEVVEEGEARRRSTPSNRVTEAPASAYSQSGIEMTPEEVEAFMRRQRGEPEPVIHIPRRRRRRESA